MSLRLMLDESISPKVAEQICLKRPDIPIESLHTWRQGAYLGTLDARLLELLHEENWLLVTFDTQILAEQVALFDGSVAFSGILFVDERTIPSNDFGNLTLSLTAFWDEYAEQSWQGRYAFLERAKR
ncbi:MAG: hypothetical protein NT023_24565 [Armatimonadetes bacterium]|nr:hypothetical protein [Armatimonadota bacterium]